MVDRIKAAADARTDPDFVIMARTDALAVEGLDAAIDRARACVEAGADMIFPEAMTELSMYRKFADAVEGAGAGQHHRVRQDAAVHGRGAALGERQPGALSAVGLPRDEQGGAAWSTRRSGATARRRTCSTRCRRATSCTTISTTTRTSRSSTSSSPRKSKR